MVRTIGLLVAALMLVAGMGCDKSSKTAAGKAAEVEVGNAVKKAPEAAVAETPKKEAKKATPAAGKDSPESITLKYLNAMAKKDVKTMAAMAPPEFKKLPEKELHALLLGTCEDEEDNFSQGAIKCGKVEMDNATNAKVPFTIGGKSGMFAVLMRIEDKWYVMATGGSLD